MFLANIVKAITFCFLLSLLILHRPFMLHYNPYNFASKKSLGYLLKVNHSLMHECGERVLAPHGFSFVQWIILVKLREGAAVTASELCRSMMHDNGALTRILDSLEQRGYVARERSQQDRRVVDLRITEAGLEKLNELMPLVINNLNQALDGFSVDEFAELTRLLEKLKTHLQDHSAAQVAETLRDPL
jgi:DNA-binding MarR family transcriptional regulator